jgi:hypothetical protein
MASKGSDVGFDPLDPGPAEEFSSYFVVAGRIPRASVASASGQGRERRRAACSSARYVAHSPALDWR